MERESLEGIDVKEIVRGMKLCQNNATDLFEEADILLAASKLPRAYALFQLAIEEIGKIRILASIFYSLKVNKEINYKKLNKDFLSHPVKTKESVGFEQILVKLIYDNEKDEEERKSLKKYSKELSDLAGKLDIYNDLKNRSLYVSIMGKYFVIPDDIIDIDLVNGIRTSVLIRLRALSHIIQMITDDSIIAEIRKILDNPNSKLSADHVELFRD